MQVGERIGPYEICAPAPLAEGGMAQVFKVWRVGVRFEAMKIPHAHKLHDPYFVKTFLRETRTAANLDHPHIVPVYNVSEEGAPLLFFTMELIEGGDLADLLKQGRLEPQRAHRFLQEFADALDYAHSKGTVHRDVKPSNALLKPREDGDYSLKVVDFGIARAEEEPGGGTRFTHAGMIVGSPHYMSPEQVNGATLDFRTDIYSLGVVAYEMLCGRPPFEQAAGTGPNSVMVKHVSEAPPQPTLFNPNLNARVSGVLLRALAKNPAERPPSCRAFTDELHAALLDTSTKIPTVPRRFPIAALAVVPLVLGAALIGMALKNGAPVVDQPVVGNDITSHETPQPPSTPAPDNSNAARAIEKMQEARSINDDVTTQLFALSGRNKNERISPQEAIRQTQQLKVKAMSAASLAQDATKLNDHDEDAWEEHCRALYLADQLEQAQQIVAQAKRRFPKSTRFNQYEEAVKTKLGTS